MVDVKSIPMPVGIKLEEFSQDGPVGTWAFREFIGSLVWLANQTRPDIANAVRAVARYCAEPREIHWKTALGILAYIKGTSGYGITFQRGLMDMLLMQVFADADYASEATDGRSVPGGLIMCGGACVQWFSSTQKCVTLSTTEAEYVIMAETMKEVLCLQKAWVIYVTESGDTVCAGVRGYRGCCAARAKPCDQLELEAHRCTPSLSEGAGCEWNNLHYARAVGMAAC